MNNLVSTIICLNPILTVSAAGAEGRARQVEIESFPDQGPAVLCGHVLQVGPLQGVGRGAGELVLLLREDRPVVLCDHAS